MTVAAPTRPAPSPLRWGVNALIALFLLVLAIDVLPQAPLALRLKLQPLLVPLGIAQGPWNLFSPGPDRINLRLRAEIKYRDGQERQWTAPNWREQSVAAMWAGHRHHGWYDRLVSQEAAPAWTGWCRHLARELRPDLPDAERGAVVRVIYQEGPIRPAELRPWRSINEPPSFESEGVLITESFE
jgi:hypothetical protein